MKKLADLIADCEARAARASLAPLRRGQQLFLPGFDTGAFPNHLNRSSIIAPIARFVREAIEVAIAADLAASATPETIGALREILAQ